jgi:hypothetical protein
LRVFAGDRPDLEVRPLGVGKKVAMAVELTSISMLRPR